jgi:hypothetical protein
LVVENDVLNDIALLAQMKRQNLESMAEAGTAVAQRATLQDFKSWSFFIGRSLEDFEGWNSSHCVASRRCACELSC